MESNEKEILQAFTDGLCGLAIALARQVDKSRLTHDLAQLADLADSRGNAASAAVLREVATTVGAQP